MQRTGAKTCLFNKQSIIQKMLVDPCVQQKEQILYQILLFEGQRSMYVDLFDIYNVICNSYDYHVCHRIVITLSSLCFNYQICDH